MQSDGREPRPAGGTVSTHPAVLRPAERLARSSPSEIEDARRSVGATVRAARTLQGELPPAHPGEDPVWRLARRLAALPAVTATTEEASDVAAADARFRRSLVDALDAVRTCRQTLHVSGACWFADADGADGCGEVLRIAHILS